MPHAPESHAARVEALYAAVARGDLDAVRAALADDVRWECASESAALPWLPLVQGRAAVAEGFQQSHGVRVRFSPAPYLESADTVAVHVRCEAVVSGGSPGGADWQHRWDEVHQWRFNSEGQVSLLRQRSDTKTRTPAGVEAHRVLPFTARPPLT